MDEDLVWQGTDEGLNWRLLIRVLSVASDWQRDQAKVYIERNIMSHIYTHAMFPNGDGDIMRDQ